MKIEQNAAELAALFEKVLIKGDLSDLTPSQRIDYILKVCDSLGLNPLTKPFDYIPLSGKLVLYAKRDCTDQLRSIHKISINITDRTIMNDICVVTARAKNPSGREDESTGAVNIKGLHGDALANALMKAETKSKRRVTLSICGLGMLDESEVETVPVESKSKLLAAAKSPQKPPPENSSHIVPEIFNAPNEKPGDYVVQFGQFKNQAIREINPENLVTYVNYIEDQSRKNGQPIKGQVLDFVMMAHQHLESMDIIPF